MKAKILLTTLLILTLIKVKSQTIAADTITNWQIYLDENRILADNEISVKDNGVRTISVKRADLERNKHLKITLNTCMKTKDRHIEIQFGNGESRYSQSYYNGDNIRIKTSRILELIDYKKVNHIILSLNHSPFIQPDGVQHGLPLIDLKLE